MIYMADIDDFSNELRTAVRDARDAPWVTARINNRLMNVQLAILDRLSATSEGRSLLLHLAENDDDLDVKIAAANAVMDWNEETAVRVLESIVLDAGGEVTRPMGDMLALSAPEGHARTAAFSLLNVGDVRIRSARKPRPSVHDLPPVPGYLLDAVERVYGLTMNGGIDHAYDVARDEFANARLGLEAIGLPELAQALARAEQLLSHRGDDTSDDDESDDELQRISWLLDADIMPRLEDISEI